LTYALSAGALPNGASLSGSGQLAWAAPVRGSYTFSISASNGAAVVAVYNVTLAVGAALQGPLINSTPINGTAASPLIGSIGIRDADANVTRINVAISGAPTGMRFAGINQGLQVQWRNPVAGTYTLAVTATDATPGHGGISNTTNVTVTIR
jgi:hypothetical protein